jgi:hypothetical protein
VVPTHPRSVATKFLPAFVPRPAFRGTRELSDPTAILEVEHQLALGRLVVSVISLPTPLQAVPLYDLESELLGLAGHIAAAECRFLQLLAEFANATAGPVTGSARARTGCPGGPG